MRHLYAGGKPQKQAKIRGCWGTDLIFVPSISEYDTSCRYMRHDICSKYFWVHLNMLKVAGKWDMIFVPSISNYTWK